MTVHYLTPEEQEIKVRELAELQKDPDYMINLTFLKDAGGWYADVANHTRSQNSMIAGSDALVERFSCGDNRVDVKFRTVKPEAGDTRKPICHLKRVGHHSGGAEYLTFGLTFLPLPAFICEVGHDVMGEHTKDIYVYGIEHRNV